VLVGNDDPAGFLTTAIVQPVSPAEQYSKIGPGKKLKTLTSSALVIGELQGNTEVIEARGSGANAPRTTPHE
jgi:hypothetical protein